MDTSVPTAAGWLGLCGSLLHHHKLGPLFPIVSQSVLPNCLSKRGPESTYEYTSTYYRSALVRLNRGKHASGRVSQSETFRGRFRRLPLASGGGAWVASSPQQAVFTAWVQRTAY